MRDLSTMTQKEVTELGNMMFSKHVRRGETEHYHSKKWRLHVFDSKGKTEKIAIVDEKEPLMHIDNLWSPEPNFYSSHDVHDRYPMFNFIEITNDLIITPYQKPGIDLILYPRSQYMMFVFLANNGFMGERAVTF